MMKKSQKLVVLFENIRVETTFAGLKEIMGVETAEFLSKQY